MNLHTNTLSEGPYTKGRTIENGPYTNGRTDGPYTNGRTDGPYIPTHISHLAIRYSIPFIYFTSTISFCCGHIILSYLQYIVYLTSIAHWSYILEYGFARNADIAAVVITLLYATFVSTSYVNPEKPKIWYMTLIISVSVFIINEVTLSNGLKTLDLSIIEDNDKSTNDEIQRQKHRLMTISVWVHMIFLHYFLCIGCIYCILP